MQPEQQGDKFESWGLLELFGHQRIAGRISEQTIGGCHFIRIDVPELPARPKAGMYDQTTPSQAAFTRFFTSGAIYSMTPTTEEVARRMAYGLRAQPIHPYDLPALPAPIEQPPTPDPDPFGDGARDPGPAPLPHPSAADDGFKADE